MVAPDHDNHKRGRLSRLHQCSQRKVPISASGPFRKVKPFQFPLHADQSASKRRVCCILPLFTISTKVKRRRMNHPEHDEEVGPRSCITDANLLIVIPAWPNTTVSLTIVLWQSLSREIYLLKTFFFSSRLIKSRFTLSKNWKLTVSVWLVFERVWPIISSFALKAVRQNVDQNLTGNHINWNTPWAKMMLVSVYGLLDCIFCTFSLFYCILSSISWG